LREQGEEPRQTARSSSRYWIFLKGRHPPPPLPPPDQRNDVRDSDAPARHTIPKPTTKSFPTRREKRWLSPALRWPARSFDGRLDREARQAQEHNKVANPSTRTQFTSAMFAGDRCVKQGRDFKLPWDVFSPRMLFCLQSRTNGARSTRHVFVGDAAPRVAYPPKFIEPLDLHGTSDKRCDNKHGMNRFMYTM